MNQIARFEKVSFEQFVKDCQANNIKFNEEFYKRIYDNIRLPKRATKGSAGYDFYSPVPFRLYHGMGRVIPTGIRCKISDGWVLMIYPRSGMGFQHSVRLANTAAIIDSDYYNADNEGHIMIKLIKPTKDTYTKTEPLSVGDGERFCQGVFVPYGITIDDDIEEVRYGGLGSTGEK